MLSTTPRDVKALAYYALVRSRLEYCCSIWDPHQVGEINRIEGIQHNAARFVCNGYRRGPGKWHCTLATAPVAFPR